jgi:hypothetical protein
MFNNGDAVLQAAATLAAAEYQVKNSWLARAKRGKIMTASRAAF